MSSASGSCRSGAAVGQRQRALTRPLGRLPICAAIWSTAAAILIGSVGAAIAYQSAPASVVSTFDFAYLAFAAMWGFLLFAEVPTIAALLGTGLIVVAGVMSPRRSLAVGVAFVDAECQRVCRKLHTIHHPCGKASRRAR